MWRYNYLYNYELYHHGVLGMKWGHHKIKTNRSKTESSFNKQTSTKRKILTKRNIMIGAAAVASAIIMIGALKYNVNKKSVMSSGIKQMNFGTIADLNNMSKVDTVLKKGTKLHRISSKPIEKYTEDGKRIYTSFLKKDNHIYKERMPDFIKSWQSKGIVEKSDGIYEHVMKAKTEIKIPSKRTMAELYMKATDSKYVDEGQYARFMQRLNDRDYQEANGFFELLKSKGYNAIIDENDAGHFTKSPLILFDLKNTIDLSKVKKITKIGKFMNILTM